MGNGATTSPRDRTRVDVYGLIRSTPTITRRDLARLTGIPFSTVNHAVGQLIRDGRAVEVRLPRRGKGTGSGHPAVGLSAVPPAGMVAAIDFGHSHITVAVADGAGTLLAEESMRIDVDMASEAAIEFATNALTELRLARHIERFAAVVAGVPGPIDGPTGVVKSPTILSSWVGLVPAYELETRLGVPVHVANDAALGAFGERHLGAGRLHEDFLYVKASGGVGASLFLSGAPYAGANGLAGEIGHIHLAGHTELCRCGNRGCLEAVVSARTVREQLSHSHPGTDPEDVEIGMFADPVADRILNEAGHTLGRPLADLCNLINPSALIIGGELGAAGRPLLDGVESSIKRYAQPSLAASIEVLAAELGQRAELLGAVQLATTLVRDRPTRRPPVPHP